MKCRARTFRCHASRSRHNLQHVPVLDDLPVASNRKMSMPAHSSSPGQSWRVKNNEVALAENPHEVHPFARVLPRHPLEIGDERRLAVGHEGLC